MSNLLLSAVLLLALAGCQSATAPTAATDDAAPVADTAAPTAAPGATTDATARAAVSRYIQTLPNATLYVPDSASVVDVDTHWQVLVPRTDWAKRMPNKAAFEVDKATGTVTTRPVK
jgi:glucose/arabinose dehydrogenase